MKPVDTIGFIATPNTVIARRVHIARSFKQRLIGLLGRKALDNDEGMLFWPGGGVHTLGMRSPIDVVFMDGEYRVLKVCPEVRPLRMRMAPRRTRFTLELAGGRLAQTQLQVGQALKPIGPNSRQLP
jgi:uncharacterized protein